MPQLVDLSEYADGYYGYLTPDVRYTLGVVQDQAGGSVGGPGISSVATTTVMGIDNSGITVGGTLGALETDFQYLKCSGTVDFTGLHVYETNADAVLAGLTDGDVYRTSAGHLRVVY